MISSWPGPDPAIHVYRLPPSVDHRVKPGDDDLRVSKERGQGEEGGRKKGESPN